MVRFTAVSLKPPFTFTKIKTMRWRRRFRFTPTILLLILLIIIFKQEWGNFGDATYQIMAITGRNSFDYLVWEANAFATKGEAILTNSHSYLDEETRKETVLTAVQLVSDIQQIDAQINQIYIDPNEADPDQASAELQRELDEKRAQLDAIQPLAEAIIQDQVGAILAEEGFSVAGQAWPPVVMHMSPLPSLLVMSPRDEIFREKTASLVPGVSTPDKEEMETAVFDNLDMSGLVVPIGGMGTFPAMIMETSSINWLVEVVAHEWAHHWMNFHPIGWNYNDPRVRVANETVASTLDVEIRDKVIERYYPEFVPPPPPKETASTTPKPEPNEEPVFDFRAEMAETRTRVDELLAEGKIEEAEQYMEDRRIYFVENGHPLRKLNQAYFAFYGAYADRPGATGSDPTGPMIRDIRDASPNLRAFMDTMADISSFEDLEAIWESLDDVDAAN